MGYQPTDHEGFLKDTDTGFIINENTSEYKAYMSEIEKIKRERARDHELENVKSEMRALRERIDEDLSEIKEIMQAIRKTFGSNE